MHTVEVLIHRTSLRSFGPCILNSLYMDKAFVRACNPQTNTRKRTLSVERLLFAFILVSIELTTYRQLSNRFHVRPNWDLHSMISSLGGKPRRGAWGALNGDFVITELPVKTTKARLPPRNMTLFRVNIRFAFSSLHIRIPTSETSRETHVVLTAQCA